MAQTSRKLSQMHGKFAAWAVVMNLSHENMETVRSRGSDGEDTRQRRDGRVYPGVILSCPRNLPSNTRKSLSDQQPNSSSASCAEAPHASSALLPNSPSRACRCIGWLVYSQMFRVMAKTRKMTQVGELCRWSASPLPQTRTSDVRKLHNSFSD